MKRAPQVLARGDQRFSMHNPLRSTADNSDPRAPTSLTSTVTVSVLPPAEGKATVSVFKSKDTEDRDGFVLRLSMETECFIPTAVVHDTGVDVHIAGEAEARGLLIALKEALRIVDPDDLFPEYGDPCSRCGRPTSR